MHLHAHDMCLHSKYYTKGTVYSRPGESVAQWFEFSLLVQLCPGFISEFQQTWPLARARLYIAVPTPTRLLILDFKNALYIYPQSSIIWTLEAAHYYRRKEGRKEGASFAMTMLIRTDSNCHLYTGTVHPNTLFICKLLKSSYREVEVMIKLMTCHDTWHHVLFNLATVSN